MWFAGRGEGRGAGGGGGDDLGQGGREERNDNLCSVQAPPL